ncbi:MAG: hypothetical protein NTU73_04210, partial [Ignavibacteriae bacterium]|nr:hypothetical protein [Ignavibacteriota bacterium]
LDRVGPFLYVVPQLLLGVALHILHDVALWGTDRLLKHAHSPRTSLPYLLLDYFVFFEVAGWVGVFGQHPWALLVAVPPSLTAFLLVRLTPAVVRARRAAAPDEARSAWRTVIGPGGRILCLLAFVTTALWLLVWISGSSCGSC